MGTFSVWGRLAWREIREGWYAFAAAIAVPLLGMLMNILNETPADLYGWRIMLRLITSLLTVLPMAAWLIARALPSRHDRIELRQFLPMTPMVKHLTLLLPPLVLVMLGSVTLGMVLDNEMLSNNASPFWAIQLMPFMGLMALLMTVVAAALTVGPALLVTVLWVVFTINFTDIQPEPPLMIYHTVGVIAAYFTWRAFAARYQFIIGRGLVVLILVAWGAFPFFLTEAVDATKRLEWSSPTTPVMQYLPAPSGVDPRDPTLKLESTFNRKEMVVRDLRTGEAWRHPLAANMKIGMAFAGFTDRRHVLILQQGVTEPDAAVVQWDLEKSAMRQVAVIPAGRQAIWADFAHAISPDGRHLVLALPSRIGDGIDLWLIALETGAVALQVPNVLPQATSYGIQGASMGASWAPDRAYIQITRYSNQAHQVLYEIDLRAMRTQPMNLPRYGRAAQ